jgi:phosphoglycolate phosphatase-like HAD superfamily hydrolase
MGRTDADPDETSPQNRKMMTQTLMTIEDLQKARAVILDFDGTLVDSNEIKLKAFDACFAHFTEEWPAIKAYCYTNNHTPRWEKFRHVYEHILKRSYTPAEEKELLRIYGEATTRPVMEAPEIRGASNFLKEVSGRLPLAVVSSTPDPILHEFLKHRGWNGYFRAIRGAPVDKAAWIQEWCASQNWRTDEVVFIGDSPEDLAAARKAQVPFVAVVNAAVGKQADGFIKDWEALKAV